MHVDPGPLTRSDAHVVRTALRLLASEAEKTMKQEAKIGTSSEETNTLLLAIIGTDERAPGLLKRFSEPPTPSDQRDIFEGGASPPQAARVVVDLETEEGGEPVVEADYELIGAGHKLLGSGDAPAL